MDFKDASGEVSGGNKHVIGNWRKGNPCYKLANLLAKLWFSNWGKVDFVCNELAYLTEEISRKSVESDVSLLLIVKCKREEINRRNC